MFHILAKTIYNIELSRTNFYIHIYIYILLILENIEDVNLYKYNVNPPGIYEGIADGLVYKSKQRAASYVTIVWHIDGAPLINVRHLQMWLITGFLIEVKNSFALKNIIVCGLWYGETKPDFDLFQIHFVQQIKKLRDDGFYVSIEDYKELFYLDVEAALHDLPAKAASLKFKQFNGRFGCSICYQPGQKLNKNSLVWIYPYLEQQSPLRTHQEVCLHAEAAEHTGQDIFGVKGHSVVLDIVSVPKEIPLDYMHLVLEGELKRKLKYFFNTQNDILSARDIATINNMLPAIKYPHDFSKKVKVINIKSIKRAKAGELQIMLLHVLLPIFKHVLQNDIFCHFGMFISAIQTLNSNINDMEDIRKSNELLHHYVKLNVDLFGEDAQTYTAHALLHLPQQRVEHGAPLILMSNFVFEGFIATIKRQFHGTRGIISQMIRNIGVLQSVDTVSKMVGGTPIVQSLTKKLSNRFCSEL